MYKSSVLFSLIVSFIGASANPVRRDTCNPNTQGQPVSIQSTYTPGLEWGIASPSDTLIVGESYRGLDAPDWNVLQTGQFPTSYLITDITNGLAATINGGELLLNPVNNAIFQPNQVFDINCNSCGTDVSPGNIIGLGCTISPHNVSDACIRIGPSELDPLGNFGCDPVQSDEVFTIRT
ncbi:hypothetical protein D9757_000859 [Collybiopsis confluens]|uniref:Uncharacterized protein n=1 Tax=Collybiopsis confluens TaxID=2823264 RepID=A0A8H5I0N2_9AGAR|nr:hypothetical protein D9757_000862 [Collybiopsis confluens]KAF5392899.1 hypothetical protein D9757_000859 [Collybiopsis confluens]